MIQAEFDAMMLSPTGDYRIFCDKYGWDTYLNYMEEWNRKENPRGC